MAIDPVCGMEVNEGQARHSTQYEGETYFFCSESCKSRFESNPGEFVDAWTQPIWESRKIAVVGTGQVGATFAFALMTSGVASNIVLIDRTRERSEGHVMDLNHGLSFVQPVNILAGGYEDCRGADIVVVTAGAAQKPGETRLDLVRKNTAIFKDIIPRITEQEPGIILVVANPVDILTYVALKVSGYPMNRVIGSGTSLDTARFRYLLSRHCTVDPRNVHAYILGEHGDSEVPVWSRVDIAGVPLSDYCPLCGRGCSAEEKEGIFDQVKSAAYEIINRKGYTNFAVALALVRIVSGILRNEHSILTVSSLVDEYYGIRDVCLSIPVVLSLNGISRQIPIKLDDGEIGSLQKSAESLKSILGEIDFV